MANLCQQVLVSYIYMRVLLQLLNIPFIVLFPVTTSPLMKFQ